MTEKFTITNENIEKAVETASVFLQKYKTEPKDALRLKLAIEDTLLSYREAFGEEALFDIKCVYHFGRLRIELSVGGASLNVFAADDEENFSQMLMCGIGLAPAWRYKDGHNIIIFTPKKKKRSQMVYIVAALLLAIIFGGLSRLLPQNVQEVITLQILSPIADSFLGLLNGVAGIMIFLSVVWSICGIGDMATLTNIGKKTISHMLFMLVLIPTIFAVAILPLFHFSSGAGAGTADLSGLFDIILGIIPTNLISPFVDGNFLQIIFIAAIVGVALLVLGGKAPLISSFVEQANLLMQVILEAICSLISLVVFITVYNMVLTGSFTVLKEAYKAPILIFSGCVLAMCVYLCLVCIKTKVKPAVFLRKVMPSFLIGLTTASSSAAMSSVMETCEKQYGMDKKIVNFGVPLGQIIFGMGSVVDFIAQSFCMAEICGVAVTPVWIVTAILTSVLLTIATPPIAGGGVALCAILFTQLGIPAEGLAIAVAIDVIADFLITATNVFSRQGELIVISSNLNMIDKDIMHKKKNAKLK